MKVLVGLSGGVDSAVAAYLLKEQGHEVTACFMRNWDSLTNNDISGNPTLQDSICPQEQDYEDAKQVANKLGIELLRMDFIEEYWQKVFRTFLEEYEKGRTPNPDILCNRYIKFDAFYDFAMEKGFEAVATGHYAGLEKDGDHAYLIKAKDKNKDQSYFLAQIPKEVLNQVLFPLSELEKPQIRRLAESLKLDSVAKKKDSTGICFIGERNFRAFLSNYLPAKQGDIVSLLDGKVIGTHNGVLYYTKGQRKGLNITAHQGPWFVAGKDVESNVLYVCHVSDQSWLESDKCLVTDFRWLVDDDYPVDKPLKAKFRYRQKDQDVTIEKLSDHELMVYYPQRIASVTEGQECVIYDGERCLGGGVIDKVWIDGIETTEKIRGYLQSLES